MTRLLALAAGLAAAISPALAQPSTGGNPAQPSAQPAPAPDLTTQPTLYVVGYAHLDTQWRWCYPQVIREFIPATLRNNFVLFEKYPSYIFNFSGSRRYKMMKEYYPQDYARLREYIHAGRWFVCGSSVDENDANVPSAESQIRHVLYGNAYARREFGATSEEFMLPDCFGFPASLPSVLAHCGIKGFSTQKLTWNAVVPIPFKVGVWNGPDGRGVVAALDPGAYVHDVVENLANSSGWLTRINNNGQKSGVFVDYHYHGVGDRGGAPNEKSVRMVEESVNTAGKVRVISSKADDLFKAITPELRAKLPTYSGELELIEHSAGSLTSAAVMKRWNRKNEKLADAAERAGVLAWTLGQQYPQQKLEDAWYLVLGSQMHDILPGTSHPYAYDYSQNDEVIASGQFSDVLTSAVAGVASLMDTSGEGVPLVVYNPVSVDRNDVVEAEVPGDPGGKGVVVTGPEGAEVPAQVVEVRPATASQGVVTRVTFIAKVPSVGFSVYHVKLGQAPSGNRALSAITYTDRTMMNSRYSVSFNEAGDVASIYDREHKRELLKDPITFQQCYEKPAQWPAWNQDWNDRIKLPMEVVSGPAEFRVVEQGRARCAVEVTRRLGSSTFRQVVSLSNGDTAAQVRFDNTIDWNARERSLRVAFPLTVSNKTATWDSQTGAVERPNSHKQQFEYAGQQWMDLTDAAGDYGVTISNDCKYASDKPGDSTLRLTLLHTPGVHNEYQDQGVQDIGRHYVSFAVQGHAGDWREGRPPVLAEALNQPMRAFRVPAHDGRLGREVSLAKVEGGTVLITAIKKAEEGDLTVIRLRELSGTPARGVRLTIRGGVGEAYEVDGQERRIGDAKVENGSIIADLNGAELRAFAFKAAPPTTKDIPPAIQPIHAAPLALAHDIDAVSSNTDVKDGSMEDALTYPAEQFPGGTLVSDGITFNLGGVGAGEKQATACKGQDLKLPSDKGGRVYLLAAAAGPGDVAAQVSVDGRAVPVTFRSWRGYVGLWDRRLWGGTVEETSFNWQNPLVGLEPGFVKDASVAWFCSHHHALDGDQFYRYCYLFKHAVDVPADATSIKLPDNPAVRVFAATFVTNPPQATPAAPLFDTLQDRALDAPLILADGKTLDDVTSVAIKPRLYYAPGLLRYTLDGSEPGPNSPEYTGPFPLYTPTTVKAAVVRDGVAGPAAALDLKVNDTTPPSVTSLTTSYMSRVVTFQLSEPAQGGVAGISFTPAVTIEGVKADKEGRTFSVSLERPLDPGASYQVTISGAADCSPKRNTMKPQTLTLSAPKPVFALDQVKPDQFGKQIKVDGLPTRGIDPWTLNLFVNPSRQPEPRTIIAGFGACEQKTGGAGRYLARFQGVHFWAHNSDVASRTPLEVGKWQMLTASYDGKTLRLFKDGRKIGERDITLADDTSIINIAPVDPWDAKRRFEGEIRGMTIWPTAMNEDSLKVLRETMKPGEP